MEENLDNIFCVIVLYKTLLRDSISFTSLVNACKNESGLLQILLYNNSPQYPLNASEYYNSNLQLIEINDRENSGVSKAYNLANAMAVRNNRQWLLLLDQDTALPENFFLMFFSQQKNDACKNEMLFAPIVQSGNTVISPAHYFLYRGFIKHRVAAGIAQLKSLAIINSGVLINTSLFAAVGGFNEAIQLDFSDIAFFRRLKKIHRTVFILDAICHHSFSGMEYNSYEKNFSRFLIYKKNAIAFCKEKGVIPMLVWLQVFMRALHLSIKFKTIKFLQAI